MTRRVVFTALFGGYEVLNDDQADAAGVDFVCFTDDASLTSERWHVVQVQPAFPLDPHRSQRHVKILGHPRLRAYDESLYIDNSVCLTADANGLFDELLRERDLAFMVHSGGETVEEAFAIVWRAALDDPHRILEQWSHYQASAPHVLQHRLLWGGIIARRPAAAVDEVMHDWYEQVLRYSRRDQLSLPYVLDRRRFEVDVSELDNGQSSWHRWPSRTLRRDHSMRSSQGALKPLGSLADAVQREQLREEIAGLKAQLAAAAAPAPEPASWRAQWRRGVRGRGRA